MNHSEIAGLMTALAPVVGDFVGKAVAPLRAENQALLGRLDVIEQRLSAIPTEQDNSVLILRLVEQEVAKIPPPADGKDADPGLISELVDKAVAAIPPAKDGAAGPAGESVTVEQLAPMVAELVTQSVAAEIEKIVPTIPAGQAGERGEKGEPGLGVTVDDVRPLLEELVAALPPAPAGKDADPVEIAALIVEDVAKLIPVPADGKSVTVEDLEPLVDGIVQRYVGAIPPAKDGNPGRDGRDGLPGVQGEKGMDGRNGVDGKDGLGIDDLDIKSIEDGRAIEISLKRDGADPIVKEARLATVLDRGVWREQPFEKGDGVTWGGSFFIAQRATEATEKPGNSDGWRLSVKKGRDGRDGKDGKNGINGKDGAAGRDGRNGF